MKFRVIGSIQDPGGRHEILLRADNGDELVLKTGDYVELGTEFILQSPLVEEEHASSSDATA